MFCFSGAWIVTGGTSTGVMEFVGDAVKDFMLQSGSSDQHVVALGIATWGIVDNRESLISEEVQLYCIRKPFSHGNTLHLHFLSPPVQLARWAVMHHFLSVCTPSGLDQNLLENNLYLRKS